MKPVAPVLPVKPVAPVRPVAPVSPVKPVAPVRPVAPVDPASHDHEIRLRPLYHHIQLHASLASCRSGAARSPERTASQSKCLRGSPVKPVAPVRPVAPVSPVKPVAPVRPVAPVDPASHDHEVSNEAAIIPHPTACKPCILQIWCNSFY